MNNSEAQNNVRRWMGETWTFHELKDGGMVANDAGGFCMTRETLDNLVTKMNEFFNANPGVIEAHNEEIARTVYHGQFNVPGKKP
jgi:hypothetical protein